MKIDIVTLHYVNNFGGALQAYALQQSLIHQLKVESDIVDYRSRFIRFTDTIRLLPVTKDRREILPGLRTVNLRKKRLKCFDSFVRNHVSLTRFYGSLDQIIKNPPKCDKYICGSDQIWNPVITSGPSPVYFLDFVKDPSAKISYAPSFGGLEIPDRYRSKIAASLASFGRLSIREVSGQKLIKEMTGRDVEVMIDPTFLLKKEEWEQVLSQNKYGQDYILLYLMQQDPKGYEYARLLKEKTGLKILNISRYGFQPDFIDENVIDIGPAEFLRLFHDARYVCTNSFHGLAFSVIFHKSFYLVPIKRFQARIQNLMELLGPAFPKMDLSQPVFVENYDTEMTEAIIEKERVKAFRYLHDSVFNNEGEKQHD